MYANTKLRDGSENRLRLDEPLAFILPKFSNQFLSMLIFGVCMLCSTSTFSQEFEQNHYQFQLKNVSDFAEAKVVTDILRPIFNTEDAPYAVFPTFVDSEDRFDFYSTVLVTKTELINRLGVQGIELLTFSSSAVKPSSTIEP